MIATLQPLFDRIDPAHWAPYVLNEPLPGDESWVERRVLMQVGVADTSVPNFLRTSTRGSWGSNC